MEAMMVVLSQTGMTVAEAARTMAETPHRLWRVLFHQVDKACSGSTQSPAIFIGHYTRVCGRNHGEAMDDSKMKRRTRCEKVVMGRFAVFMVFVLALTLAFI